MPDSKSEPGMFTDCITPSSKGTAVPVVSRRFASKGTAISAPFSM